MGTHLLHRYTKLDMDTVMRSSSFSGMVFGESGNSGGCIRPDIIKSEIPPVSHITSRIVNSVKEPLNGTFKPYVGDIKYLAKNSSTEVKNNSVNCVVDLPGILKGKLKIYPLGNFNLSRGLIRKEVRIHYTGDSFNGSVVGDSTGVLLSVDNIAVIELNDLDPKLSPPIQFHTDFDLSFQ